MNAVEARQKIEKGVDYKYVCQLVPPMLAIAKMSFGSHAKIGIHCKLVEINFSLNQPYKIKQPSNFKAGKLKVEPDGTVKHTGYSTDFSNPENAFLSDEELQSFFEIADIKIIS